MSAPRRATATGQGASVRRPSWIQFFGREKERTVFEVSVSVEVFKGEKTGLHGKRKSVSIPPCFEL